MYYNSTEYQIRNVAVKFIRTMNNKLKGVPNFYIAKIHILNMDMLELKDLLMNLIYYSF